MDAGDNRHTLGLASMRRGKGIALEQIAEATKIGLHYLQAIEEEAFEKLPGGVYNTSYIRQYARAIHCEDEVILDYYRAKYLACPPAGTSEPARGKRIFGLGFPHARA